MGLGTETMVRPWHWWHRQRRLARSAELGLVAALLAVATIAAAAPRTAARTVGRPQARASANPPQVPDVQPAEPARLVGSDGALPNCAAADEAPPLSSGVYPRIVIPRVGINVPVYDGRVDSRGVVVVPDGLWVGWFFPGLSKPGEAGNTYIYAHAHGSPAGSAPGLFWPLHYMHDCDMVYVYTDPGRALRYQVNSVNLHWPGWDGSILSQTADERVTLQTCNDWAPLGPKTIVTALRLRDSELHLVRPNRL